MSLQQAQRDIRTAFSVYAPDIPEGTLRCVDIILERLAEDYYAEGHLDAVDARSRAYGGVPDADMEMVDA